VNGEAEYFKNQDASVRCWNFLLPALSLASITLTDWPVSTAVELATERVIMVLVTLRDLSLGRLIFMVTCALSGCYQFSMWLGCMKDDLIDLCV